DASTATTPISSTRVTPSQSCPEPPPSSTSGTTTAGTDRDRRATCADTNRNASANGRDGRRLRSTGPRSTPTGGRASYAAPTWFEYRPQRPTSGSTCARYSVRERQSIAASATATIDTTRPAIQPATSAATRIAPRAVPIPTTPAVATSRAKTDSKVRRSG